MHINRQRTWQRIATEQTLYCVSSEWKFRKIWMRKIRKVTVGLRVHRHVVTVVIIKVKDRNPLWQRNPSTKCHLLSCSPPPPPPAPSDVLLARGLWHFSTTRKESPSFVCGLLCNWKLKVYHRVLNKGTFLDWISVYHRAGNKLSTIFGEVYRNYWVIFSSAMFPITK